MIEKEQPKKQEHFQETNDNSQRATLNNFTIRQCKPQINKHQQQKQHLYNSDAQNQEYQKDNSYSTKLVILVLLVTLLMLYIQLSNSLIIVYGNDYANEFKVQNRIKDNYHNNLQNRQPEGFWRNVYEWLPVGKNNQQQQSIETTNQQPNNQGKIVVWSSESYIWVGGSLQRDQQLHYFYFKQLSNYIAPFLVHIRRQITIDVTSVRGIQFVSQYHKNGSDLIKSYSPHLSIGNFGTFKVRLLNSKVFDQLQQLKVYPSKIINALLSDQKFLDRAKSQVQFRLNKKIFIVEQTNRLLGLPWDLISIFQRMSSLQKNSYKRKQSPLTIQIVQSPISDNNAGKNSALYIFMANLIRLIDQSIDTRISINRETLQQFFKYYKDMLTPIRFNQKVLVNEKNNHDL